MLAAHPLVIGGDFGLVVGGVVVRKQLGDYANRPRGVRHVNDRAVVVRRDLDCGVRPAGRCAADQQRNRFAAFAKAQALHFCRNVAHLFERRGDQT